MKKLLYIILLAVVCMSCRSIKYVPVEKVRTEYKSRDSIRHDSVFQRDSIYKYVKGDSVFLYKDRYLYKYLYLNKTDTVIKRDSVPYPVEVVKTVTVEKELSWWQTLFIWSGAIAWAALIVVLFIRLNKHTNWFFWVLNILRKL